MQSTSALSAGLLPDSAPSLTQADVEYIKRIGPEGRVQQNVDDAEAVAGAAVLVLMHSIVDDAIMDGCRIIAMNSPLGALDRG